MLGIIIFGIISLSASAGYTIYNCNDFYNEKNKNKNIETKFIKLDNDELNILDLKDEI